jgi:hypothetical protein
MREDAAVARRLGHEHDAKLLEDAAEKFESSLAEYLTWISEADARIRSGTRPPGSASASPTGSVRGSRAGIRSGRASGSIARSSFRSPRPESLRADARRAAGE